MSVLEKVLMIHLAAGVGFFLYHQLLKLYEFGVQVGMMLS